ncbi:MAG: EAL domain-containing protein [Betaproteobacteria bacterium]|nr:EAL domain-containing protein [Betaproteobacteria bacterium]
MLENEIQNFLFFLLGFGVAAVSALILLAWYYQKQKSRLKEVNEEINLLAATFYDFPQPMCVTRLKDGSFLDVNLAFEKDFGWKRGEIIGKSTLETGLWQNEKHRAVYMQRLQSSKKVLYIAMEFLDGYERMRYAALTAHAFATLDNSDQLVVTSFFDRTVQKQAEDIVVQENNRFRELFHSLRNAVARCDRNRYYVECNRAFLDSLGYTIEELKRMRPLDITPEELHEQDIHFEEELHTLPDGQVIVYEKEHVRKDGSRFPVELQLYPFRDTLGQLDGFWGVVRDLSERTQQQEKLDFLVHHDSLTGLPNRILFTDRFEHAIGHAKRSDNQRLALILIDLDRFKNVNDTLGHQVGDTLLCVVAGQLQKLLRSSDTLARLDNDEFVILLEDSATMQSVTTVVGRLEALFEQPMLLKEQEIYLTASIGISLYPGDGDNADTLLKCADIAMFKAKELGRNTWQFYESAMSEDFSERLQLSNSLRNALQHHELLLCYQPLIDMATGKLVGVEALVRWMHPEHRLMLPDQFIPLAEDMGIISSIDNWVLQEACQQMRYWREKGFNVPRMSVNISVQQLERPGFVDFVRQHLEKNNLDPELLELEITESTLMQRFGNSLKNLHSLRDLGIYLSVDDFGTGYSSLGNLKKMPVHKLKIDYSFICDIGRSKSDEAIASVVIAMARSLGLEIVAEGIERQEQEAFLLDEGCQIAQGFYYAKAMPADKLLAQWGRETNTEAANPTVADAGADDKT